MHLIRWIKAITVHQALRKAECHGSVVGPLTWIEFEWPAADHVANRFNKLARSELEGGPHRITNSEAYETPAIPISFDVFSHKQSL